jgi:NhaP-type Na+/H+ or K+/H+ antiporter
MEILVVGESLVNDAVVIVLFKLFKEKVLHEQKAEVFDFAAITINFSKYCLCSILTGMAIGIGSALYFKYQNFAGDGRLEAVNFLVMAYVSFVSAEWLGFSGIFSTLVCGGVMAGYTERNLSDHRVGEEGHQTEVRKLVGMFATFAEEMVFLMTGMAAMVYYSHFLAFFSILVMIICLFARAVAIFPLAVFTQVRCCGKLFSDISKEQATMLWFGGLRGAVAMALAVDMPSRHRHTLTACTCFVVFFTVAIMGGGCARLLKVLGIAMNVDEEEVYYTMIYRLRVVYF